MQIKNKRIGKFSSLLLVLLCSAACLLFSCSNEEHARDLHHYVTSLKNAIAKHKKKDFMASIKFPTPVTFQAIGKKRDPFVDEQASYNASIVSNPSTAYPVKSFEFVGVISRDKQDWAVIKAPDNKMYEMTIGDRMGDHYGRIVKIYPNRVEVEEEVTEQEPGSTTQGVTKRMVTLQLKGGS